MGTNGFKGLGWLVSGVVVVLGCYMVTSWVAAERAKLAVVNSRILQARLDIRGLETEFDTRANLVQLERWNGGYLALQAPGAPQYVGGETQLASLDRPVVAAPVNAVLRDVVPSGPAPAAVIATGAPVQTASAAAVAGQVRNAIVKGKGETVAMLDRKLLSDTTLGDLMRSARDETAGLR
jgi:hypothetical protein